MAHDTFTFEAVTDNDSLDIGPVTETSSDGFFLSGTTDNPSLDAEFPETHVEERVLTGEIRTYSDVLDGYLYGGLFYRDAAHTVLLPTRGDTLYVDVTRDCTYRWTGQAFAAIGGNYVVEAPASDTWVIDHNMNKYPTVTTIDSNGCEVFGDVRYVSLSRVEISFGASFSGKAILN